MSHKTTIFITAIAAVSIGALGAGAAAGLGQGPGPDGRSAQRQLAEVAPDGRPGLRFGPTLGDPENPAEARRIQARGGPDSRGPQIMIRGAGGGGFAHGGMPQSRGGADRELDLTGEQAGTLVAAQLIMQGNDRLKVGAVSSQGEDTYIVDVVTLEDSLVMQIEIDRDTGRRSPVR